MCRLRLCCHNNIFRSAMQSINQETEKMTIKVCITKLGGLVIQVSAGLMASSIHALLRGFKQ